MHSVLIGIINAVIPGLGYLILRRRVLFGWLLLAGTIAITIAAFLEPIANDLSEVLLSTTFEGKVLEIIFITLWCAAFGIDGYNEAREKSSAISGASV